MDKLKELKPIFHPKSLAVIKQGSACPASGATFNRAEKNPTPCGNQHP